MVSAETLKIARAPNLLTSRRVSNKIAMCVIDGFSTGEKSGKSQL